MSITVEFRHGTIRPTILATPRPGRVVAAKVGVSMLIGIAFGLTAAAVAAGVGSASLAARGLEIRLDGGLFVEGLLFGDVGLSDVGPARGAGSSAGRT